MVTPTIPKVSVFLIAHNEEKLIERCLRSIEQQTQKPNEVVLVAHNCTDKTVEIAKKFPWLTLDEYNGPKGTAYARAEGFLRVTGDIILSTDGDAVVPSNWVEALTKEFEDQEVVGVGSPVIYTGNALIVPASTIAQILLWNKNCIKRDPEFWGPSFAVRRSAYEKVGGFEELFRLKESSGLTYWLEDNFLSNRIAQFGKVIFLAYPIVLARVKPNTVSEMLTRARADLEDRKIFEEKIKYHRKKN